VTDAATTQDESTHEELDYESHVGPTRQYWRDMILGVNDGLVSIFLLAAGVVGGGLESKYVLLAATAAAIGGAISMGTGEFLATQSQEEVLASELDLERSHIRNFRDEEIAQLQGFFTKMGVEEDDLPAAVTAFTRNDEVLFNTMKTVEFGIVDTERRSPYTAMLTSSALFLLGSLSSIIPFALIKTTGTALVVASTATGIALFSVGALKTFVTRTNPIVSGLQNLIVATIGGVAAFYIGVVLDSQIS